MPDPAAPPAPSPAPAPETAKPAGTLLAGADDKAPAPPAPKVDEKAPNPPPEGDKKPEGKEPEKKVEEIALKLPEGFNADPALLGEFQKLAQESGLKPEVAQKLVEFQAKINGVAKAAADKEAKEFADKEAAWRSEAEKIPPAELGLAKRAMLNFTKDLPEALRDETRSILQTTWMGNHPGVLKVLAAAGKFIAEDKVVEGGSQGSAPFTAADFYAAAAKKK